MISRWFDWIHTNHSCLANPNLFHFFDFTSYCLQRFIKLLVFFLIFNEKLFKFCRKKNNLSWIRQNSTILIRLSIFCILNINYRIKVVIKRVIYLRILENVLNNDFSLESNFNNIIRNIFCRIRNKWLSLIHLSPLLIDTSNFIDQNFYRRVKSSSISHIIEANLSPVWRNSWNIKHFTSISLSIIITFRLNFF